MEPQNRRSTLVAHLQPVSLLLSFPPFPFPRLPPPSLGQSSFPGFPVFFLPLVWMHNHHSNSSGSVSPFTRIPAALEDVQSIFLRTLLNSEGVFRHALLCNSITRHLWLFLWQFFKSTQSKKERKGSEAHAHKCSLSTFTHVLVKYYFQNLSEQV